MTWSASTRQRSISWMARISDGSPTSVSTWASVRKTTASERRTCGAHGGPASLIAAFASEAGSAGRRSPRSESNRPPRLWKRRIITARPRARGIKSQRRIKASRTSIQILRSRLDEASYGRFQVGHGAFRRHDDNQHPAPTDLLDEEGRIVGFEQDPARGVVAELRRRGHARSDDGGAHDRKGLLRDGRREFRGDHAPVTGDDGDRLSVRHVLEGAHHLGKGRHAPPSRSNTHSRAPMLAHSTSASRTRCFVLASSNSDRIPRSRWHVSTSPPAVASMDPRTRTPASVKRTSSAQPRSMIVCLPTSSGSSPSDRDFVISSAKTIPSRKNRPWHA